MHDDALLAQAAGRSEPPPAFLPAPGADPAALVDGPQRRLAQMLRGAVETSAALVEATDPATARRRLLDGFVQDMGLAAAVLWSRHPDARQGIGEPLALIDASGLPAEVRRGLRVLPAEGPVARVAAGERGVEFTADAPVARAWPGHYVVLLPVPPPSAGVLGVYADQPMPHLATEVFATLAHALASAVHQTTLHRRAQTVVQALQRELMPRPVALPGGAEVGHVYESATAGVPVGGDFFDVFVGDSGHVGVACGDVSGKGVEAASLTAMAVYSLRAYGLAGWSAQAVTTMLNGTVCVQTGDERFITLAYARIDPTDWTVQLSLAGHPPGLVTGPAGVRAVGAGPDLPVGLLADARYDQATFRLRPGESLVLFTDGVSEARHARTRELLGSERVAETVSGLGDVPAQRLADAIWEAVQCWSGGQTTDDCAVIVLRRPAQGQPLRLR